MRLEITGIHTTVDRDLEKYLHKKIGRLDHYLGRTVRPSVHAEVKIKPEKRDGREQHSCEVILHLPKERLAVKECTLNNYAAVDIVEAKLISQIKRYKDLHGSGRLHQRLAARFRRATA